MVVILLVPVVAALLLAGLISAVSGTSFDNAMGLLLTIAVVVGLWVGIRKLIPGLLRWWASVVRDVNVRASEVPSTKRISDTATVARQAMDAAAKLAVHQQTAFRQTLEKFGAELDEAQSQHGAAGTRAGEFTGSKDIPFLLAAFARETLKNLGTGLLGTQQTANRSMAEAVDRGVVGAEDGGYPAPRRSIRARGDDDYG